tara:strand:+ start:746 stop:1594 length:849 start_codon:yes stop_codon:yes gene_type:complete
MYKYKLKEIEVGDTDIRKGVKTTVSDVDPETGAITYDVENVANFTSTYKALQQAREFLNTLEKTGNAKDDTTIDKFAEDIAKLFNAFRSHVRKNYPKEYERVLRLKEALSISGKKVKKINRNNSDNPEDFTIEYEDGSIEPYLDHLKEEEIDEQSSTAIGGDAFAGGEGAQYATPFAFRKKGKKGPSIYYYKLGYKPVPKIVPKSYDIKKLFENTDRNQFQSKRIAAFKEIEERLNKIYPLLSNAKDETAKYYNENPGSYAIVYSTDYIFELLDEIEAKLNI